MKQNKSISTQNPKTNPKDKFKGKGNNKPFNGNNKPKGGKPFNKQSHNTDDSSLNYEDKQHSKTSGKVKPTTFPGNDITWYQRVPNLLDTAKQVAFNIPLGTKLKSTNRPVPGIIALDYEPITGYCESGADFNSMYANEQEFYDVWASTPFNIAMRDSYSKVRSSKGGSRPYDYPDLAQMLLSASSIFAYIVHLQRVLKCANRFNFQNKYLGSALVAAFGFNYSDLIQNYIQYVGRINLLIEKAKSIAIPAGIAVLSEWLWRNSNIFLDTKTDNVKNQYLVDVPNGYYIYDEVHGDAVFKPVTVKPDAYLRMPAVLSDLESAVAQLWNSETFALLMGDLRFAYKDNVVSIPQMGINDSIEPIFSLEHAIEVQNMNFLHSLICYDNGVIYTTGDYVSSGLLDENLVSALTVHQDLRSAENNNGAVFAGPAYSSDYAESQLRGYTIYMGRISDDAKEVTTKLMKAYHDAGFWNWSFINMYSDVPDGETLIYSTRMKMVSRFVNSEGGYDFTNSTMLFYQIFSSSACLWLGPRILLEPTVSATNSHSNGFRIFNIYSNTYNVPFNTVLLYGLSNFNVAPKAVLYVVNPDSEAERFCHLLGDIEVGTDIANESLATLQSVCLYSQWLIPDTISESGFTPRELTK